MLECKTAAPVVKLLPSFHFTLLMEHSDFFQISSYFVTIFSKATDFIVTVTRQKKGNATGSL
jgi:hypothetical protein